MKTGLSGVGCIVYINDIIVTGSTFPEHLDNLRAVLERLRSAQLKLKPKKCNLAEWQVEYLGHVVSQDGLSTDPNKMEAVRNLPVLADLRSFWAWPHSTDDSFLTFQQLPTLSSH